MKKYFAKLCKGLQYQAKEISQVNFKPQFNLSLLKRKTFLSQTVLNKKQIYGFYFLNKDVVSNEDFKKSIDMRYNKTVEMQLDPHNPIEKVLNEFENIVTDCKTFFRREDYPEHQEHIMRIVVCLFDMGQKDKAQQKLLRLIDILKEVNTEPQMNSLASAYSYLGKVHASKGEIATGLEMEKKALEIYKDSKSPMKVFDVSESLRRLGELYYLNNNVQEGILAFEESLKLMEEKYLSEYDTPSSKTVENLISIYERLAVIHSDLRNKKDATDYINSAINLQIKLDGDHSFHLLHLHIKLASILIKFKDWEETMENLNKSKEILERLKADHHTTHYHAFLNLTLAEYYKETEQPAEALMYLKEVENIYETIKIRDVFQEKTLAVMKIAVLNSLGLGNETEDEIQVYLDKHSSKEDLDLVSVYQTHAYLTLFEKRDFKNALQFAWKAYEISEKLKGKEHESCATSLFLVARIYIEKKEWPLAIKFAMAARNIVAHFPNQKDFLYSIDYELAFLYDISGDKKNTLKYLLTCKNGMLEDFPNMPQELKRKIMTKVHEVNEKILIFEKEGTE